jgi:hypothetical protein
MQAKPALHPLFAQQRCPLPPHGAHACPPSPLFWQESPAPQAFAAPPVQHAWPLPPQAPQVPSKQRAPGAVQVPGAAPPSVTPQHI